MSKKLFTVEPITADPRFAAAQALLQTLQAGVDATQKQLNLLRAEKYLDEHRGDKRAEEAIRRIGTVDIPESATAPGNVPRAVAVALALLREGKRPFNRRADRATIMDGLIRDHAVLREGVLAQQVVVDAIRGELSEAIAKKIAKQVAGEYRDLILRQFRAAQALAATTDEERAFRRAVTEAGFTWRSDLLPAPLLRGAVVLGSELDHDSDVSRARRMLEELKAIP